jgi:hypothetical protein
MLLLYPLVQYIRYIFCTTVEIYDKVATNKTCRNKICMSECYNYIDVRIFIGFLMFIYFFYMRSYHCEGHVNNLLHNFFVTYTLIGGGGEIVSNHPLWLHKYLDHIINLACNIFGHWIHFNRYQRNVVKIFIINMAWFMLVEKNRTQEPHTKSCNILNIDLENIWNMIIWTHEWSI